MSRNPSAYEQVRDLCSTLSSDPTVTARRKASEQLRNVLGDARYQARLGRETGHDPTKIALVWRLAVVNSILAAQRLMEGGRKAKVTAADLRLPGQILLLADRDSGQYRPGIFSGGEDGRMGMMYGGSSGGGSGGGSASGGSGSMMGRTSGGISGGGGGWGGATSSSSPMSSQPTSLADPRCLTRLTSKEIQKLLDFCFSALADEACREAAESDLMNTLSTLCSRSDYVTHIATEENVEFILSEIEERLLPSRGDDKGRIVGGAGATSAARMAITENAAKTLANLVYHLTASLGYGMHMRLAKCFDLILTWCQLPSSQPRQTANQCLHYVVSAATSLLLTHPDQCVPIMRKKGRYLLALVKKSFTLTSGQPRDALIDYFSAHL